ncbi:DUF433 domain-containing protein [candidate division KSB1 bacterium]|nr:DUF433 domain-containing protein [candidate division KSB1 bacterium]
MEKTLSNRIEINPEVMLGKPVIRGTRITVELLLKKLAQNIPVEEILTDFPGLEREDLQAAIAYAAMALSTEDIFLLEAVA